MDLEDLYRLLRNSHVESQGIVDNIDTPVAILDQSYCVTNVNPAFARTFQNARDDSIGHSFFELGNGQWNVPELKRLLSDVIPKAAAIVGYEITHAFPQLGERTMLVSARRIRGPRSTTILVQFDDVTDRRRDSAARDILLAETRHRGRNLMALARALATQTETEGRSATEYRDAFLSRLEALLAAQDMSEDAEADLAGLVGRIVGPIASQRLRVSAGAPAVLTARQILPLALILHELMTNAVKYGALSTKTGVVNVAWAVEAAPDGQVLTITWSEKGGPRVNPSSRKGFGSRLIEHSARELRGTADLRFEPEGLHATLQLPLT
jgi:two-component sensor histidine kinase